MGDFFPTVKLALVLAGEGARNQTGLFAAAALAVNSSHKPSPLIPIICGALIVITDQWTKRAISPSAAHRQFACAPNVRFRFTAHRSKIYERTTPRATLIFTWVLALLCGVILCQVYKWFQSNTSYAGLGLAYGGAVSNLIDILRHHYVINFIDLGWWPVFNLADVAILAGLGAAFLA